EVGGLDFIGQCIAWIGSDGAVQVHQIQHGGGRGDIAAYMATHAVGQDREVLSDIGGVVIFLADSSDVGLGGKFKLQSHRLSLQFQDSLPDADTLPRLNCLGAGQLAVSYEGSVGGTEVFNEP